MNNVKRPTGAFIGVLAFSVVLYLVMMALQPKLMNNSLIPDYNSIMDGTAHGNPLSWILWFFGDMTEANYHKTYLGGIGLVIGSLIAHYFYTKNSKHQGIAIAYGSGLWLWVLGASSLSLALSNIVYGWNLVDSGWFPTFVVFVSVPAATILTYGGGWKNLITSAIAAVIIVVPLSRFVMVYVAAPIGLPSVVGSVFGMWFGGAICFEIYKSVQWMQLPAPPEPADVPDAPPVESEPEFKHLHPSNFFIRRLIADFSEPCFAGNEIAGAGLLIGTVLSWLLCPLSAVYGATCLPTLLMAEFITGAVSIYVYWDHWMEKAWFPSFPSMVSVAPGIVVLYGGSVPISVIAAILGGFICPALTDFVIRKLPPYWPPVIGTTFSMTIGALVVGMLAICIKGIVGL